MLTDEVAAIVHEMVGQPCCRAEVGWLRSLSVGFGNLIPVKGLRGQIKEYGEWEAGVYFNSWRIIRDGKVLCGSRDSVDTVEELDLALKNITFGKFVSLQQLTAFDIRIECDNRVIIDFLITQSGEEEGFHIFCPRNRIVTFTVKDGWRVGPADGPWKDIKR